MADMSAPESRGETAALTALRHALARGWRPMLAVYLACQLLGLAALGPLSSIVTRWLVSLSGEAALSDTDIASFVLSPAGAAAAIVIASLVLAIEVIGYAALLVPARRAWHGGSGSLWEAIGRTAAVFPSLIRLAARFLLHLAWVSLPFAAAVGLLYLLLLGDHDINYYLAEKPPEFRLALALAAAVGVVLVIVLVRVIIGWFHSLPRVVFHNESPRKARRTSRQAAAGRKREIGLSVGLWLVGTPVLAALVSLPGALLGGWLIPMLADRLALLALVLGILVLLGTLVTFAVGFITLSLLALQNVRLYELAGLDDGPPAPASEKPAGLMRIGPRAWLAAAVAVIGASTWYTYHWLGNLVVEDEVEIIAHRGASGAAPENTMAAVKLAIEQGADWVEIDVQETADGEVVVFHDSDFKRVGGRPLRIWDARMEDLGDIDIGSWFGAEFASERTPTLREVLETCRGRCGVVIELKYYGHDQRLEERVVEIVEQTGMADHVKLMSLSHAGVRKVRALRPDWPVGLLTSVALGDVTRLDLDFLGQNGRTATPHRIRRAHRAGIDIYVWTINEPVEMSAMISRGVDGLITDEPGLGNEVLTQRASLHPAGRLLLELATSFGRRIELPEQ